MNRHLIVLTATLLLRSQAFAFEMAELKCADLDPIVKDLPSFTQKLRKNWNVAEFKGREIDGIICWGHRGSGVSTYQVVIYAKSKYQNVYTPRVYQEFRLLGLKVVSDQDTISIRGHGDRKIAEFSIASLDPVDANEE